MSKRKLEEEEDSLSTASSDSIDSLGNVGGYRSAKRDRRVRFSERIVFHFPRTQGYTCVPSNGGSTLGMKHKHAFVERTQISDVDDFSDSDDSYDSADSEDGGHCFMPIPQKIRKDILKAAGVKKINKQEAIECMQIRYSRQICGCSCKEFCEPETCSCYVNGINCQVDRDSFPCGCTRDGCRNTNGRHEYDPITVRRHFIDTVVRLRGEKYFWHGTEKEPSSNSQTSASVISFTSVT